MTNGIRRKVVKQGNSRVIVLPPALLDSMGWSRDQQVNLKIHKERKLIVEPVEEKPPRNLFDTKGGE